MKCTTDLLKIIVLIFTLACVILGLTILIVASISVVALKKGDRVSQYHNSYAPEILVGLGSSVFIISILGVSGAYQRNECRLSTFKHLLFFSIGGQLGVALYGLRRIPSDDSNYQENFIFKLVVTFQTFAEDEKARSAINAVQSFYECCGIHGYTDYENLYRPIPIPGTCCDLLETETCPTPPKHTDGCGNKLYDGVKYYLGMTIYVTLGIILIEIVAVLLACSLLRAYDDETSNN